MSTGFLASIFIGVCVPSVCNQTDVLEGISQMKGFPANLTQQSIHCYTSTNKTYKPMTTGAIVMMVVCSIFGVLVLAGTTIEYIVNYNKQKHNGVVITDSSESLANVPDRDIPMPLRVLICFSLIDNYRSFFHSSSDKKYFSALDGVRTLSSCWVVLGHTLVFNFNLGFENINYILNNVSKKFAFQSIWAGEFAVTLPDEFVSDLYTKPWSRIGPYVIGIAIAFLHAEEKIAQLYTHRSIRYFGYLLGFAITFFLSFIPYSYKNHNWTVAHNALYNAFAHTLFPAGLSLFLLSTFYGYGGLLRDFLSHPIWKPFSKLTYSTYLIHPDKNILSINIIPLLTY
eukprot:gene7486-8758_t